MPTDATDKANGSFTKCPNCGNLGVSFGEPRDSEKSSLVLEQEGWCTRCQTGWVDQYAFTTRTIQD